MGDLGTGAGSSCVVLVGASLVPLCLLTDLRNDPEHGAVLWHKEQLRLLSRESQGGEGGSRADGARGDPECHQVTRRHFNKRQNYVYKYFQYYHTVLIIFILKYFFFLNNKTFPYPCG